MTAKRDLDVILSAWLDEGPVDLPDATRRAVLTSLPTIRQARRGHLAPWRQFLMNGSARIAAAAVVAAIAIGGVLFALGPNLGPGGPSPSPIASPVLTLPPPTAAPTVVPPTRAPAASVALTTFTSTQYGYSVGRPQVWAPTPATEAWPVGGAVGPVEAYVDRFFSPPGAGVTFVGIAAQPVPDGMTDAAWMLAYAEGLEASGRPCGGPAADWTDTTVAGVPARELVAQCDPQPTSEVAWVVDGVGYVISGNQGVVELMLESFRAP